MTQMVPAMIMGYREGLDAFLVIAVILKYLSTTGKTQLKAKVYQGGMAGKTVDFQGIAGFLMGMKPDIVSITSFQNPYIV